MSFTPSRTIHVRFAYRSYEGPGPTDSHLSVMLPAIPRVGEYVCLEGREYMVRSVVHYPFGDKDLHDEPESFVYVGLK